MRVLFTEDKKGFMKIGASEYQLIAKSVSEVARLLKTKAIRVTFKKPEAEDLARNPRLRLVMDVEDMDGDER
ncbi:MAG: hypothetical protein ACREBW_01470 [Candidatus Micrarchaeaceae archaeon]